MENHLEMFGEYQLRKMEAEIKNKEGQIVGKKTAFCLLKDGKIVLVLWDSAGLPERVSKVIAQIKGAEELIGAAK